MRVAAAEFAERDFAQNNGPRILQLPHNEGVALRAKIREQYRAKGGRHSRGVNLVLEEDRYAVEGPDEAPRGLRLRVKCVRLLEYVGIQRKHRVEGRTLLVIGINAIEVHPDQSPHGQPAVPVSGVNVLDSSVKNFKATRREFGPGNGH